MLALVVSKNTVFALGIVRSLGAMGARAHVIGSGQLPRARFSRYCDRYLSWEAADFGEPGPATIDRINQHCQAHGVDIVIAGDMAATIMLARIGDRLMVPTFPLAAPELLGTLHDKWVFHQLLTRLGLPSPRTRRLEAGASLDSIDLPFPLMAKPTASEGHDRVARYDRRADLEAMLATPAAATIPWLLQEYLPGQDIDLSLLADRGRLVAWTIQSRDERGDMVFTHDQRMVEVGRRLVEATGFHGVAHFDMRVDERNGELAVIECNPRFWGSLLLSVWSGVNFVEMGCAIALRKPVPRFAPVSGISRHEGFAPRRMMKALLIGRTAPEGLSPAILASWKQVHLDPLPELIGVRAEQLEARWRRALPALLAAPLSWF
jgi:predicted ATP-grasp superfamily ATP-dependent carboligase